MHWYDCARRKWLCLRFVFLFQVQQFLFESSLFWQVDKVTKYTTAWIFFKQASPNHIISDTCSFLITHTSLSSCIMVSNKINTRFGVFFYSGWLSGTKAFVLCVDQHICILVVCICTQDEGVHLLHYNKFIARRSSQKG